MVFFRLYHYLVVLRRPQYELFGGRRTMCMAARVRAGGGRRPQSGQAVKEQEYDITTCSKANFGLMIWGKTLLSTNN